MTLIMPIQILCAQDLKFFCLFIIDGKLLCWVTWANLALIQKKNIDLWGFCWHKKSSISSALVDLNLKKHMVLLSGHQTALSSLLLSNQKSKLVMWFGSKAL